MLKQQLNLSLTHPLYLLDTSPISPYRCAMLEQQLNQLQSAAGGTAAAPK